MGLALFSPLQTLCAGRVKHIESTIGLANIFLLKDIVNIYTYIKLLYIYYCISFVESKARRGCVDCCAQQAEESAPYEFALAL